MSVRIVKAGQRLNARVPLRVGDVWVYIGPATEHRIVALSPRPTGQKSHAQLVELDDRTITEATLRYAFKRKQEYEPWSARVIAKFRAAWDAHFGVVNSARVLPFRRSDAESGVLMQEPKP